MHAPAQPGKATGQGPATTNTLLPASSQLPPSYHQLPTSYLSVSSSASSSSPSTDGLHPHITGSRVVLAFPPTPPHPTALSQAAQPPLTQPGRPHPHLTALSRAAAVLQPPLMLPLLPAAPSAAALLSPASWRIKSSNTWVRDSSTRVSMRTSMQPCTTQKGGGGNDSGWARGQQGAALSVSLPPGGRETDRNCKEGERGNGCAAGHAPAAPPHLIGNLGLQLRGSCPAGAGHRADPQGRDQGTAGPQVQAGQHEAGQVGRALGGVQPALQRCSSRDRCRTINGCEGHAT